jgi:hypothetical protein
MRAHQHHVRFEYTPLVHYIDRENAANTADLPRHLQLLWHKSQDWVLGNSNKERTKNLDGKEVQNRATMFCVI